MVAAVWSLYPDSIQHDAIIQDWYIICAAWKWLGDKRTGYVSGAGPDDKAVVERLHKLLSEADVLVAHNGDRFDLPKFNARAIKHGLEPIPPIPSVDTLKHARRLFKFSSNRLDYIAQFLGVGKKMDTPKGLWMRALQGDAKAIKTMVRYCRVDVDVLEGVYLKLRGYMTGHPNWNVYSDGEGCSNCGSTEIVRNGVRYTKTGSYPRYKCSSCGASPHRAGAAGVLRT